MKHYIFITNVNQIKYKLVIKKRDGMLIDGAVDGAKKNGSGSGKTEIKTELKFFRLDLELVRRENQLHLKEKPVRWPKVDTRYLKDLIADFNAKINFESQSTSDGQKHIWYKGSHGENDASIKA